MLAVLTSNQLDQWRRCTWIKQVSGAGSGSGLLIMISSLGAVATLTTFKAAVELGLKVNITVTVGLVENFLANNSYRPSDIIRSHKGLTVEIGNTDAEGRLVLADCMSWTQAKHSPKVISQSFQSSHYLLFLDDDRVVNADRRMRGCAWRRASRFVL